MGTITFSGPVLVGPNKDPGVSGAPFNQGGVICAQSVTLGPSGTATVSATFWLAGTGTGNGGSTNIVDVLVDTLTAFNSGSGATFSLGPTAGSTLYASGVSVTGAARVRPTFTAAQLAAMSNQSVTGVPAPQTGVVVASITPSGTAATAGLVLVTVLYQQTS